MQTMLPLAGWLAPIFLLRFTRSQRTIVGIPVLALVGAAAMVFAFRGILDNMGGPVMTVLFGSAYGLLLIMPPYLIDRLLAPRLAGLARSLVFPCAAVVVELLLASFHPLLGTLGFRAYAHYGDLSLLQLLSVTGIWGLAFLTAWAAAVVNHVWERGFAWRNHSHITALFGALLLATLLFGSARVAFSTPAGSSVRIAAVAANERLAVDQPYDLRTAAGRTTFRAVYAPQLDELFTRTRREARAGAQIVAWPEAGALVLKEDELQFLARAATLAREEQIYLQVALISFLDPDQFPARENRAVLFDPAGTPLWDYAKSHPVPGGEASQFLPGPGVVPIVETPYGRLATVICYDADFPSLVRQAGQSGADLLLVPASDWAGIDETHAQMATFRAIENGITLVRPTRQGQMIAVDYRGVTLSKVNSFASDTPVMVVSVPASGVPTLYARIGDSFAYLCGVALMGLALAAAVHGRTRVVDLQPA
jgi:apolipoprotein N-acyltransferase